jgi:hypothetical protein
MPDMVRPMPEWVGKGRGKWTDSYFEKRTPYIKMKKAGPF